MKITDFIKKYNLKHQTLAELLGISQQSFRNKLVGVGKSKPFTDEQNEKLYNYIMTIGEDTLEVRAEKLAKIRQSITEKCSQIRSYQLDLFEEEPSVDIQDEQRDLDSYFAYREMKAVQNGGRASDVYGGYYPDANGDMVKDEDSPIHNENK